MADHKEAFVGIDVAKLRNAVAIADAAEKERFVSLARWRESAVFRPRL